MFPTRFPFSARPAHAAVCIALFLAICSAAIGAAKEPGTLDAYLPADGVRAVVAVADAPRAWQVLDAAGLGNAMLPAFRGAFASLEWALVAVKPKSTDAPTDEKTAAAATPKAPPARRPGPPNEARAALLTLARVADAERLRDTLPGFEQALAESLGAGKQAVGRTEEAIGDVRVVVLSNGEQTAGFLLSGRAGVWATCTDADLLRATARLLAKNAQPAAPAKGPLADARAAVVRLAPDTSSDAEPPGAPPIVVLLPAPASDSAAALGAVDWLRAVLGAAPGRPAVAGATASAAGLRIEALAVRPVVQAAAPSVDFPPMGDVCAAPGALLQWGTSRLDPEGLRQALLGQIDGALAALPPPDGSGLTPASDQERQRLGSLRATLADPQTWPAELGPEAWLVCNRFDFGKPGELPAVDLMAAARTRDEAATRAHLASWEARLLATAASPSGPQGRAPRFAERDETLGADGSTVRVRWLDAPSLPSAFRPAWALRGDMLCVALSPEALVDALKRASAPPVGDNAGAGRALAESLGVRRPGAALAAWPARSTAPAAVLQVLAAQTAEPWMAGLLRGAADRWAGAASAAVAREAGSDGVRTVVHVTLRSETPANGTNGTEATQP